MLNASKLRLYFSLLITVLVVSCTDNNEPAPETDARDQYVGTWTCSEKSKVFNTSTYSVVISKAVSDKENIIIKNFYNLGSGTSTIVKVSNNNLTVGSQLVSGQTMSGSGSYSNGKINLVYYADDGTQQKDTCSATCTK